MILINETEARTMKTATATMYGLAAPSQGSTEVSTWRVEMAADQSSLAHIVDYEQVWMPISGAFEFRVDGRMGKVSAGQAIVVAGGVVRQFQTSDEPAQALVCMRVGGKAQIPGSHDVLPLPWAE